MDLTPTVINQQAVHGGRIELVEWHWPNMIDWTRTEPELMLEMSLPPLATDASASFPDIAPDKYCFMGSLFVRCPGIAVRGRSEGGHIRVIRCVFSSETAQKIMRHKPELPLDFLQSLLNIRNDALRTLMRLAHRELINQVDRSVPALDALMNVVVVEMERLFERQRDSQSSGRLAGWQYRRIRDRLNNAEGQPTVAELAKLCGISTRHLHRQFLALTGKTISKYIENFWIEKAKDMLLEQNLSIKEIALACGFSHANSFSRAFRRVTGLSPQKFRQRAGDSGSGI
ncbi:MAG: helix-turn-helix transcriptional regulator [Novosphingobium sp.]|nr:helix-turn-helix transcriptional regulator [Novosphingobium sp.]